MSKAWVLAKELRTCRRRERVHTALVWCVGLLLGAVIALAVWRRNHAVEAPVVVHGQLQIVIPEQQYRPELDDKDWRGI